MELSSIICIALVAISNALICFFLYRKFKDIDSFLNFLDRRADRNDISVINLKGWQQRHDTNYITVDPTTTEKDKNGNFVISGLVPNKRNVVKIVYPEGHFPMEKIFEVNI